MKVLILKTNETVEHIDSYAARLIEQGRAVLVPAPEKKTAAKKKKE